MTMNNESEATFSVVPLSAAVPAVLPQQQQQLQDLQQLPHPQQQQQQHRRYESLFRGLRSRSRPVRRALVELGRNDSGYNAKFAARDRFLTISVEQFRDKYNFDPIKMKPMVINNINTSSSSSINTTNASVTPSSSSSGGAQINITGGDIVNRNINNNVTRHPAVKYQWDLIGSSSSKSISSSSREQYWEQKQLEQTVCSLVSMSSSRYQPMLRRVPVPATTSEATTTEAATSEAVTSEVATTTEAVTSDAVPEITQSETHSEATSERLAAAAPPAAADNGDGVVSSSTEDSINETAAAVTAAAAAAAADDNNKVTSASISSSSSSSSRIVNESITSPSSTTTATNNEELERRLAINISTIDNNKSGSNSSSSPTTVGSSSNTAAEANNNNTIIISSSNSSSVLRQSKITDFAPHRKRVHSSFVGATEKQQQLSSVAAAPDCPEAKRRRLF